MPVNRRLFDEIPDEPVPVVPVANQNFSALANAIPIAAAGVAYNLGMLPAFGLNLGQPQDVEALQESQETEMGEQEVPASQASTVRSQFTS